MYSLAYKTYGHADVELRIRLELGCTYAPEAAKNLNHITFFFVLMTSDDATIVERGKISFTQPCLTKTGMILILPPRLKYFVTEVLFSNTEPTMKSLPPPTNKTF